MGMFDDFDLETMDAEKLEKDIETGGVIPAGEYNAVLIGYVPKERDNGKAHELTFQIADGDYAGREVKHTLYPSTKSPDAAQRAKNVVVHFSKCLGLLKTVEVNGKKTFAEVNKGHTFGDQLGHRCVIEVIIDVSDIIDKDTKKPTGKKWTSNRLSMFGIKPAGGATTTTTTAANHSTPPSTTAAGQTQKAGVFDDL